MIQTVKTTIRWRTEGGNVVGAVRIMMSDMPNWGKKRVMREGIDDFLCDLQHWKDGQPPPMVFEDYVIDAFNLDAIITIKSKTDGSYIHLKDEALKQYIAMYKERTCKH